MTLADCRTHCLCWLLTSSILYCHVRIRARPCLFLVASGLEDTFVGEDEMATVADDLVDLVSQLDRHVSILLVKFVLLLRHVLSLDLLKLEAIKFENLAEVLRLDDSIRKLTMEQPTSLGEAQMCLSLHILRIEKVIQLSLIDSGKSYPLGSMKLARIELRWLDALPLYGQLLLGKVMAH